MATVFIWNNNFSGLLSPNQHSQMGHSALNMNDKWGQIGYSNRNRYVSWWPTNDSFSTCVASTEKSFLDDLVTEKYVPDHIIRIEDAKLKTGNMQAEWIRIQAKPDAHYRTMRKNCSTIVARVLRSGTSAGGRHRRHAVWTPLRVKRFALAIGGYAIEWDQLLTEMKNNGAIDSRARDIMNSYMRRDARSGKNSTGAAPRFSRGNETDGYVRPAMGDMMHHPAGDVPLFVGMV